MQRRYLNSAFDRWSGEAASQQDDVEGWLELLELEANDCLCSHFSAWRRLLLMREDR